MNSGAARTQAAQGCHLLLLTRYITLLPCREGWMPDTMRVRATQASQGPTKH